MIPFDKAQCDIVNLQINILKYLVHCHIKWRKAAQLTIKMLERENVKDLGLKKETKQSTIEKDVNLISVNQPID